MAYISKRRWPLRQVVDRLMSFESTHDYPDGLINETLECGHVYRNNIAETSESHTTQATKRRCHECATLAVRSLDPTGQETP